MFRRHSLPAWTLGLGATLALGWMVQAGCSAGGDGKLDGTGGNGTGANGTGATGGGITGQGGSGGLEACADETYPGELVPLDLYVLLDKSSSMSSSGKWGAVETALQTFVSSPESAGIGVGLGLFPAPPSSAIPGACNGADINDPACGLYGPCLPGFNVCGGSFSPNDSCDPGDYATPALGIAELPTAQTSFVSTLTAANPDGDSTPSQPAMEGATVYAKAWAEAHASHLTYIVFASDGDPTNCSTNSVQGTANAAQSAANANPPVKTFVIGVGTELTSLNQIAQAGGTSQAYLVDTGNNVTQQFIDALNEIRAMGQCLLQIPVPLVGTPDYQRVNVVLVDPGNPSGNQTVKYVTVPANCDPTDGGWYYDSPSNPHMIILCPETCGEVQTGNWDIKVLLGCETVVQ